MPTNAYNQLYNQGPLLLTWSNCNISIDTYLHTFKLIIHTQIWDLILGNFSPHFMMVVITYPWLD